MVKLHKQWSEEERARLLSVINRNKGPNNRVRWENVTSEFPDRTQIQLKAYYFNIIMRDQNKQTSSETQTQDQKIMENTCNQIIPELESACQKTQENPTVDFQTQFIVDPVSFNNFSEDLLTQHESLRGKTLKDYSAAELMIIFTLSGHVRSVFVSHFPSDSYSDVEAAYSSAVQLMSDIVNVSRAVYQGEFGAYPAEKILRCLEVLEAVRPKGSELIRAVERGCLDVDQKIRMQARLSQLTDNKGTQIIGLMRAAIGKM